MTLKIPLVDTSNYRFPPEVEAAIGGRDNDWHLITDFRNNWHPLTDPTCPPPSYRKDSNGFVHLHGLFTGGVTTQYTVMANLPPGFRPRYLEHFPIATFEQFGEVTVNWAGDIQFMVGNANWFGVDGVHYFAEN